MKKIIISFFLFALSLEAFAQFGIVKGNSYLEFSGSLVTYYNHRFYPAGTTDFHKDRFALDVMELQFKGCVQKDLHFNLDINFSDLVAADTTRSDYYAGGGIIREAYVNYSGLRKFADFKVGYMKVPFSRSSIVEFDGSPFLERAEMCRGDVFSRRDVGIELSREFVNRRLNIRLGAYTGLGEGSLGGDNDASGKLQYIGRVDYAWPARYRLSEYDLETVPVPVIAVGVNGMYAEKKSNAGIDYGFQTIDGTKTGYGFDASFKYKGLSLHFEALQFRMQPNDTNRLLGKPTDYFLAGGIVTSINYYWKRINSVFAVRYDEFNPNDLIKGDTEKNLCFAYNYLFDKINSCVKIQYWYRLDYELSKSPWTDNQFRIAYQFYFNPNFPHPKQKHQ